MLARVLAGLPEYLDKTPGTVPGLSVQHASARITIARHQLLAIRADGTTEFVVDLVGHTLQSLADNLNGRVGYTASVTGDAVAGAASLLDVTLQPVASTSRLDRATSLLWAVMRPIAWGLDASFDNLRAGLQEMSLKTADGQWINLWGEEVYGAARRLVAEADRPFADRIMREVQRWRINSKALEVIVNEDTGLVAKVSNLHDQAWVVGETVFGKLAARKYSRTTFEVLVDGVSADLASIIDRNRAAGTLPYFLVRESGLGVGGASGADVHVTVRSTAVLAPHRVWTIGVDGLGDKKLSVDTGNEVIELIGVHALEAVLKDISSSAFGLGTTIIGLNALGGAGAGVDIVALSDTTAIVVIYPVTEPVAAPTEMWSLTGAVEQVIESLPANGETWLITVTLAPTTDAVGAPSDSTALAGSLGSGSFILGGVRLGA